jgi:hypothetical protein
MYTTFSYFFISLFIFTISCGASIEDIKNSIIKELNDTDYKIEYDDGRFDLDKKFKYIMVHSKSSEFEFKSVLIKKMELELLEEKGYIVLKQLSKYNFDNVVYEDYFIEVTEKGKNFIIGETQKKYIFKTYEYKDIDVVEKIEMQNDTIKVRYTNPKIDKTPFYRISEKTTPDEFFNIYLKDTQNIKLIFKNNKYHRI